MSLTQIDPLTYEVEGQRLLVGDRLELRLPDGQWACGRFGLDAAGAPRLDVPDLRGGAHAIPLERDAPVRRPPRRRTPRHPSLSAVAWQCAEHHHKVAVVLGPAASGSRR